ncbi:forkhead box protein I3 [Nematostella vectensis]|uniref:forkhead box protein I3 n=1 Tax=Nematostella vectensis TaxID=45351 RepID=UPI0020771510|nr:forkhead box protein I3 [Nematostella vectensis]
MYSVESLLQTEISPGAQSAMRFPFISNSDQNLNFLKGSMEKKRKIAVIKRDETEIEDEIAKQKAKRQKREEHGDDDDDDETKDNKNNSETFVAVIAQAILSVPTRRMTLSCIYNFIAKTYPHFDKEKGPGWRNSVRHNLSSNDCFVKASRAENGKGHYWMIHPKDLPEFSKGNFRRPRKPRRPRCIHGLGCLSDRTVLASALNSGFYSPCKFPEVEFSFPRLPAGSTELYTRYGLGPRYEETSGLTSFPTFSPTSLGYAGLSWSTEGSAFRNYATLSSPVYYPYVYIPRTGEQSMNSPPSK